MNPAIYPLALAWLLAGYLIADHIEWYSGRLPWWFRVLLVLLPPVGLVLIWRGRK